MPDAAAVPIANTMAGYNFLSPGMRDIVRSVATSAMTTGANYLSEYGPDIIKAVVTAIGTGALMTAQQVGGLYNLGDISEFLRPQIGMGLSGHHMDCCPAVRGTGISADINVLNILFILPCGTNDGMSTLPNNSLLPALLPVT